MIVDVQAWSPTVRRRDAGDIFSTTMHGDASILIPGSVECLLAMEAFDLARDSRPGLPDD